MEKKMQLIKFPLAKSKYTVLINPSHIVEIFDDGEYARIATSITNPQHGSGWLVDMSIDDVEKYFNKMGFDVIATAERKDNDL